MLIIGRITSDAVVKKLKDEKQVVNFSVAENHYYKPKGGEGVQTTTYYNCSYWISSAIAARLTKGALVEIMGRVKANAWTNLQGESVASINVHADTIKIHTTGKGNTVVNKEGPLQPAAGLTEPADDLPFYFLC